MFDPQRAEEIFAAALERPAAQRADFVRTRCGGDEALRADVRSLLRADEQAASDFRPQDPIALMSRLLDASDQPEDPHIERCFGVWRLRRLLAEGGMGKVYLAARTDEYEQRVAVKLIRRGMDTDEILRRFRIERRVLANLEHPNIARFIDAGATEDGLPYLVMEYVAGTPIDRYCDEKKLAVAERLELFRRICSAVHHAHRNLVVHRDLKPGNVMVDAAG
ncbi:MAG: protein kinase, partial [Candidatus Eisenbacteria bacterium]|nr:protein kinase [Candidatus Eisenbacteria bacterium]